MDIAFSSEIPPLLPNPSKIAIFHFWHFSVTFLQISIAF